MYVHITARFSCQGNALPQDPRLQQQSTSYPQQLLNYAAQYPNKQPTYPQQVLSYAAQNPQSTLQNPGSHQPVRVEDACIFVIDIRIPLLFWTVDGMMRAASKEVL